MSVVAISSAAGRRTCRGNFTAGGGGGAVTLDMRSDWASQSVGATTDAAARDTILGTATWDEYGISGTKAIRDASGSGLPAAFTRYCEFAVSGTASSWVSKYNLTVPSDGGARYWRAYVKWHVPDNLGPGGIAHNEPIGSMHPIEQYHGDCPFLWEQRWGANGGQTTAIDNTGFPNNQPAGTMQFGYSLGSNYLWQVSSVDQWAKDTWYRIEWAFTNYSVAALTCRAATFRIYNMSGTLLVDETGLLASGVGNSLATDNPLISTDPHTQNALTSDTWNCITRMTFGSNGPGSWDETVGSGSYMAVAGVASSLQGWIGPYAVGY